jgi:hypothetical protein
MIGAINSQYHKRTHKFGIEVPKNVKHALEIDQETGHKEEALKSITYSSVVSRDSIRNIGNAYLNADCREKVHTTLGVEFGQNMVGKTAIICKALYGLKASGAAWRAHLAATLCDLQYHSSLADPDIWL